MTFTFKIEKSAWRLRGAIIGKPNGPASERVVAYVSTEGVMTFVTNKDTFYPDAYDLLAIKLYRLADVARDAQWAMQKILREAGEADK